MMKAFSPHESLGEGEVDGLADIAATFYDMLVAARPELGVVEIAQRRTARQQFLSESAVMMHGYAALMKDFHKDLVTTGTVVATETWKRRLERLRAERRYSFGPWSGDLFDKANPLWQRVGVIKPGRSDDKVTVVNTGGARIACGRVLRQLLAVREDVTSLEFLAPR